MAMPVLAALFALSALLAPLPAQNEPHGEAGRFDYYILALSWSPAYCSAQGEAGGDAQCAPGRRFAFVLHGLWPQYELGLWPQYCSAQPGLADPALMLDIMPSPALVRHEWSRHGSCSGLAPAQYFALARRAFSSIRIPPRFQAPARPFVASPSEIKKDFLAVNPALSLSSIAVQCRRRAFSEAHFCLDRNLKPRPCARLRECREPGLRVLPVR